MWTIMQLMDGGQSLRPRGGGGRRGGWRGVLRKIVRRFRPDSWDTSPGSRDIDDEAERVPEEYASVVDGLQAALIGGFAGALIISALNLVLDWQRGQRTA